MQTKGLDRNVIDKYYTNATTVELCMSLFKEHIDVLPTDLIIEPSAGNGAFINKITELTTNYLFYDLEPENENIQKQDYLELIPPIVDNNVNIHVIGNPPFGRQSSTAKKFIKKSCSFCNTISFILPKSFKKTSMQSCFPPYFHIVYETDLPDNAFTVSGEPHNVPCIFQIWKKMNTERAIQSKLEPDAFSFVKKDENPDISFRRVGVYAGKIDTDIDNKSEQSHYFIKFTNGVSVLENIKKLSSVQFQFNNTVGPKSISKQELISQFNVLL